MLKALFYVVPIALALYALIDLQRSKPVERADIHPVAWVALIILLPVVGPIAWILVSRSRRAPEARPTLGARPGPNARPAPGTRPVPPNGRRPGPAGRTWPVRRPGPLAPDDDPDFLWRLEQQQRRRGTGPGGRKKPASPLDPDTGPTVEDTPTNPTDSTPPPTDETP
ncbi:PLD nuclease N-terminal domain-containing protein [Cellulomonas sp. KRMCY2]|uniref:PLD nuclease N-terminal domain-containing protein n=1 Tax=Cellulomonas sp. KRMCY2 TaxID=1304865 RepID=UPI00045E6CEA|nr:PLD nuclease N-terminal domain-containing protein [Cellulomonas sp. KRMCY2]